MSELKAASMEILRAKKGFIIDMDGVIYHGNMLLPAAEDMLPLACQLLAAGKTVAVEHAEPVYLRNTVAWKKLPGRE